MVETQTLPVRKVLVTGAAGQLGSRLVHRLLDRNVQVRGTILPDDPCAARPDGLDVERRCGDLKDMDFVRASIDGVDAVLHPANMVGAGHFENNTMVTFNIARACAVAVLPPA